MKRCPSTRLAAGVALLVATAPVPASARPVDPAPLLESEFAVRQSAPERTVDVHHLRLDLTFDLEGRRVAGGAALTLSPIAVPRDEVTLHAVDLEVEAVEVEGVGAAESRSDGTIPFALEPGLLRATLPRAYAPGETLVLRVSYSAAPRLGLYFVGPDEGYSPPLQAWSQGECEEHRHWFPAWDYPSDRATSEMIATVPAGTTAVSNGVLESRRENGDGTVTFHWHERRAHVNYLVSIVAGRLAHIQERYGDIPLDIYVPPGAEGSAARSFGNTADMMRVFEEAFGHPYPYDKYAQTTVHDFRWGGMENVGATTYTERTLHDEAAHLTFRSDDLVAHELAHQWFGDLITCRSWSHIWLNEALATFAEQVYFEARWGEEGLADKLLGDRDDYLEEYSEDYRRPIVTDLFAEPDDLFDAHIYQKGGLVLHMLRRMLGEDEFWLGLRRYVDRHAGGLVETSDLRRAFEEATGRDLGVFFEQWIHRAGHPVLAASWWWDAPLGQVVLEIEQVQPREAGEPFFDTPLDVRIAADADGGFDHRVRIRRDRDVVRLPAPARPRFVQLDPEGWLLAEIDCRKGAREWVAELAEGREVMGRVAAARALGDFTGDPVAVAGLGAALRGDASRHVRGAAALALGEMGTEEALAVLAAGLEDPDARVRLKVAEALGSFTAEGAAERAAGLARRIVERDPSPPVVGAAAEALGATGAEWALDLLARTARRSSHDEAIRRGAYAGMAATEDEAAIPHLLRGTRYGMPWRARAQAIAGLGKLARVLPERRDELRARLVELVADRHFDARRQSVAALGKSEDPAALPLLRQLARTAYEPGVRSAARGAVWRIRKAEEATEAALSRRLAEVERQGRELSAEVERLRARVEGGGDRGPEAGGAERR